MTRHRHRRVTPAKVFRRVITLILDLILIAGLAAIVGTFFGVRPYVVESGSMEPAIRTGSVCFINSRAAYEEVQAGDVVCYQSVAGKRVIHRAVEVTDEGIETKGDANDNSDGVTTTRENYIGTVLASVPGLGFAVYWIQTTQGMVMCIALMLILFILAWEPASDESRTGGRERTDRLKHRQRKKMRV